MLGRMTWRSTLNFGAVLTLVTLGLAGCGPSEVVPSTDVSTPTRIPTSTPQRDSFDLITSIEDPASIRQVSLSDHIFDLEIAVTEEDLQLGLMHRENLPKDAGMLFVFPGEISLTFWMKNTLIPLGILFMDAHGIVVDIQTMFPQPGAADAELLRYPSAAPAQYALEINAGVAHSAGFEVGNQAYFR